MRPRQFIFALILFHFFCTLFFVSQFDRVPLALLYLSLNLSDSSHDLLFRRKDCKIVTETLLSRHHLTEELHYPFSPFHYAFLSKDISVQRHHLLWFRFG